VTSTLGARVYVDPACYRDERSRIFARQWQLAAFRAQLRAPGDYAAHEFAGWRVVVVVQDDGSLRAFHNVCRHRAGPLVTDAYGSCTNLVCRYHGWSYARDGSLRSARDFGADLDPAEFSLFPVRVEEWRGLVFVNLDDDALPLEEDHAAFFDAASDQPLETFAYSHRLVHEIAANWKVYGDNYMEGYHVPLIHPELNREIVAKDYRVDVGDRFCEHSAPTRNEAVNAGRWLWRFPNLALNTYADGMNVERFVPVDHRRTRVTYDLFFRDLGAREENEAVVRIGCTILDEDRVICEAVQRNLESGVYDTGRLSPRHEQGVAAFQQWISEACDTRRT
jgi:choline monooxygenase